MLALLVWLSVLTSKSSSSIYDNVFAVRLAPNVSMVSEWATRHNMVHMGNLGSLEGHHLFLHPELAPESKKASKHHYGRLVSDPEVEFVQQQRRLKRVKRRAVDQLPTDPWFGRQWYLDHGGVEGFDMNVERVWRRGITGRGVVVSILDDGVQRDHPDLEMNFDALASSDVNDNDDDPMPRDNGDNKHGTRCAGEVAAQAFNDVCGVGVAYNASIGGVRMLDGVVNDAVEARALSLNPQHIHVFSASWGPDDDGKTVDGPGPLAQRALASGVSEGRGGLGSIFVWASGNGGSKQDNCNCDGYTNSIFTLSISSVTQNGRKPWYLEECASTLASTFSSGTPNKDGYVVTVDQDKHLRPDRMCTDRHTGTSASAPLAAGILALALQANPGLTWRDVQHLVVRTANPRPMLIHPAERRSWQVNGANRLFSLRYGYGLMDALALVNLAEKWEGVSEQYKCTTPILHANSNFGSTPIFSTLNNANCENVVYLEHVQCVVTLQNRPRGAVHLVLISPSGTRSTLLLPRPRDVTKSRFTTWPFLSVQFWGEIANGTWTLRVSAENSNNDNKGLLKSWHLVFFGTRIAPPHLSSDEDWTELLRENFESQGNFEQNENKVCEERGICRLCDSKSDKQVHCVTACPENFFLSAEHLCVRCSDSCQSCFGPKSSNCLSCRDGHQVLHQGKCEHTCPHGFHVNNVDTDEDANHVCVPCPAGCLTCEEKTKGNTVCLQCHQNLVLVNNTNLCLNNCPFDHYLINNNNDVDDDEDEDNKYGMGHDDNDDLESLVCLPCPSTCATCSSGTQCTSCKWGHVLNGNRCVDSCPSGKGVNEAKLCEKCALGCQICTFANNQEICEKCSENFTKDQSGICIWENDQVINCEGERCNNCPNDCSLCTLSSNCLRCKEPLLLLNNSCLESCPSFYFESSGKCRECSQFCEKCKSPNHCDLCKNDFELDENNLCRPKTEMIQCHSRCKQCFGEDEHSCISCAENEFLFNHTCLAKCDHETFANLEREICENCHSSCHSCYGPRHDQCKDCKKSHRLDGDKDVCLPCAQERHVFDHATKKCVDEFGKNSDKGDEEESVWKEEVWRLKLRWFLLVLCSLLVPIGAIVIGLGRARFGRFGRFADAGDHKPLLNHEDNESESEFT